MGNYRCVLYHVENEGRLICNIELMEGKNLRKKFHLGVNTLFLVPGDVGGTETYVREMLLGIVQEYPDLRMTLFTNCENDSMLERLFAGNPSIQTKCLGFRAARRPIRILLEQILLPFAVMKSNVDVLWSPGYTAPFWSNCPQAVTVHDLQYKNHPDDLTTLERYTLDALVRMACRRCQAVIAVSQFSRDEIISYGFADAMKVFAVLEGVDSSFGEPVTDPLIVDEFSRLGIKEPFILCVAHTYPHKNVHVLVDAFAKIAHKIPHSLVIVGKARLGETAMQVAMGKFPDPNRLLRIGQGVPFDLLRLLYQRADVFVLPSTYEGFGLPVLEAMMAGTPVITVRKASLSEVGGAYAHYIEDASIDSLADKIVEVTSINLSNQTETIDEAKKWAERFTWKGSANETMRILLEIGRL